MSRKQCTYQTTSGAQCRAWAYDGADRCGVHKKHAPKGIETIKAYRASDGKLFESEAEANKHQSQIDGKLGLNLLMSTHLFQSANCDDFMDFLIEHAFDIRAHLNTYLGDGK